MNRANGWFSSCLLLVAASGCSAITTWPEINESAAGKPAKTGGAGGKAEGSGTGTKGGSSSQGGATNLGGTTDRGGGPAEGGVPAGVGGVTATLGGSVNTNGGSTSMNGGAGQDGGIQGGATNVVGGSSSNVGGGSQGGSSAAAGGKSASGGTTTGIGGNTTGGVSLGGATQTSNMGGAGGTGATLTISAPTLPIGRTGAAYTATVTASGATTYAWSITSGSLPGGIALQDTTSASVVMNGTPIEAGLFPLTLSVTDGTSTKTINLSLQVTHRIAFLSDRITSGVKELFLADVGTETAGNPVQLSASISSGNVSTFAWSPDGLKIAYTVATSSGASLYVSSVSTPGSSTLVSANVSQYLWLAEGEVLVYTTLNGGLFLVDVSTAEPWTVHPEVISTSGTVTIPLLVVSPKGRKLALASTNVQPDPAPTSYYVHVVSWDEGAAPVRTQVASLPGSALAISFSYDGGLLAVDAPNVGLYGFDLSAPGSSGKVLTTWTKHAWSPVGRTMFAQQNQLTTGLQFVQYVSTWSQTTLLLNPSCTPTPGPWSPDGNHALYTCGADVRAYRNISAASSGTDATILPSGFLANSFTNVSAVGWSPDSQWIALFADKDTSNLFDIYLTRWASPGVATKPYATSTSPGVSAWKFAPSSSAVAFVGAVGSVSTPELYLTTLPVTGTPSAAVPLTSTSGPAVQDDVAWLPGSRVVLYRANDSGGAQLHAVHVTPIGTSSTPIAVSGTEGTGVPSYQVAPMR